MCFRFATMVKVMITSSDHELHLPTWTLVHVRIWSGYLQTPKNVLRFSASQMKNPIRRKAIKSGIVRSRSSGRNTTLDLAYNPSTMAARYQR
jgi:hypothetical protein